MNKNKFHRVNNLNSFELTRCNRYYTDEGINRTNKDKFVTCLFCIRATAKSRSEEVKRQLFCTLHGTTCTPDDEGYAECGDLVKECHWLSQCPRIEIRGMDEPIEEDA